MHVLRTGFARLSGRAARPERRGLNRRGAHEHRPQDQPPREQQPGPADHLRHQLGAELPFRRDNQTHREQRQHQERESEIRVEALALEPDRRAPPLPRPRPRHISFQDRTQDAVESDDENDRHHREGHPLPAVALDRYEQIALDEVAEHEAQDQRRARPFHALHHPAQETEDQQGVDVAPLPGALEGADEDDRQHDGRQDADPHERDLGELVREHEADPGAEDIGEGDRPDQRVGDV